MSGTRGCLASFVDAIRGQPSRLENLCKPYKVLGLQLFVEIGTNSIFANKSDSFVMAFLMKIKHIGDKFRAIDSFILTEKGSPTLTGTIDTFLMRYCCLANLYICCANKNGGDLTINDIKQLTPDQLAIIKYKKDQIELTNKINNAKMKLNLINNEKARLKGRIEYYIELKQLS